MTIAELYSKWNANSEFYREQEIGSGVHSFVKDFFLSTELTNLQETAKKTEKFGTFTHDSEKKKEGRPDFVLYLSEEVTIPVEVKCFEHITEGINQLRRYQLDYSKQFGILTDGFEWRFYRAATYTKYTFDQIREKSADFLTFWNDYIKPERYYLEIFNPSGQQNLFSENLFPEKMDLNEDENRKIFFEDTTKLINKFRVKLKTIGIFHQLTEKQEVETTYSYLIQFILYKVLVDAGYQKFTSEYQKLIRVIKKSIIDSDFYNVIVRDIRDISEYISQNIYKPFSEEQSVINQNLAKFLKQDLTIDDIAPWLDILIFIDKYNFGNLKNEIFGFIYENFLKDLYQNEKKGQYFTDPAVVNFMLDFSGFTSESITKTPESISLIDPSCGAGTFLYSAVDRIIDAFFENKVPKNDFHKQQLKDHAQKIEKMISSNIFGLDIEEFPLYLAEMNILMRLLPLIVNDHFENPVDEKLKIFKTKDSISEFLDAKIGAINPELDFSTLFSKTNLGYPSFMRDNKNLQEMIESMQGHNGERLRFDFVFGNPPYIGYNECSKQKMEFIRRLQDKNDKSISMGDVYGVNLNTVPDRHKPYSPKPNLYAFFVALSFSLLKKNGKICFIIPQTMLISGDLDVLRYYLAKFKAIEKIATFEGNLFIDRGIKENKPVATSSLVLVATNTQPDRNHQVEIINFEPYLSKKGESFKDYFSGKNKGKRKQILQTKLLESIDNWNFIKNDNNMLRYAKKYSKNTLTIEQYRRNVLSHYDEISLDGGLKLNVEKISRQPVENCYPVFNPKINNYKKFTISEPDLFYDKNEKIEFIPGGQGMKAFENQYKIIWKTRFNNIFQFSDTKNLLLNGNQSLLISSNNKNELLFILSLLNSPVSLSILKSNLKLSNEAKYIVALTAIKQYIRIPKINSGNQSIKNKIIELTEKMLLLENVTLKDLVDFSGLMVQRFESLNVKDGDLVLGYNTKEYRQKIACSKMEFVKHLISEKLCNNRLNFGLSGITISELKNLEAIDFEEQKNIKKHIDNLVFALYFNVDIPENQIDDVEFVQNECKKIKETREITHERNDENIDFYRHCRGSAIVCVAGAATRAFGQ